MKQVTRRPERTKTHFNFVSIQFPQATMPSPLDPKLFISLARQIVLILPLLLLLSSFPVQSATTRSHEAYVTLLYGDEFLLGVRVLGKSIRDAGTTKDMVVLVSDGVSDYAKDILQADGWIVEKISLLANPNRVRPTRFWGVYTKLKIFNLTNYRKVVYLDADTIVIKSIEDLFKCGKFCANLKHSERLNSGVMVVEPSEEVFKDMMSKVNSLESYTGGDQGFLNSYFTGFANAHVFEPNISPEVLKSRPEPEMERLSTLYNADVGLYMLANKWMVNENELRVIHYTLGPLKPWDWWTSWLLKPVDVWQTVREHLGDSLPGTGGGSNPKTKFLVKFLFVLPICIILLWCNKSLLPTRDCGSISSSSLWDQLRHLLYKIRSNGTYVYRNVSTSSTVNFNQQVPNSGHMKVPGYLGGLSIVVCFVAACVAFLIAVAIIPRQVRPWTGLLLMYEWTLTIFYALFRGYLEIVYKIGRVAAIQLGANASRESSEYDSGKGHQRYTLSFDLSAWFYWLGMASLAIIAPALPCFFGITALFARLGLMVGGGIVLASFMAYASEHLALKSFIRGFEERDSALVRSICFIC